MRSALQTACRSPEATGVICGMVMLFWWPLIKSEPLTAGWALLALTAVSALAGFAMGAVSASLGQNPRICARRGGEAGAWAALSGAAVYMLLMSSLPYIGRTFRPHAVAGAALMPAMLGGAIAAALGMMAFLRPVAAADEAASAAELPLSSPPPPELPALARWSIRGVIFAGLLLAVMVPFMPARWVDRMVAGFPGAGSEGPAPSPASKSSPAPPFHYEVPAALAAAPPVTWKVVASRTLGPVSLEHGIAFSHDGRFVAHGGDGQDILVRDLHSEDVRRISPLPLPVRNLQFSPDGQRLFVVMESDPLRVGVAELKSGKFIPLPQPKKHAVPDGRVLWWTDTTVLFSSKDETLALDLDTLEFDPAKLSKADSERFQRLIRGGFPFSDQWSFNKFDMPVLTELPEVEGKSGWGWKGELKLVLWDSKRVSIRIFPEVDLQLADKVTSPADGSKVLRFRAGSVTAFYFGTGPVPPLGWKVTLPDGPERLTPSKDAGEAAETGQLSMMLYRPLINPLNNRTVGPDREHPKGVLRITKWEGTSAEAWMEGGIQPWEKGDVFADVHVPGESPVLLAFDQPHRWWMAAPDPEPGSDDPSKIPLRSELRRPKPKPESKEAEPAVSPSPPEFPPAPVSPAVPPARLEQIRREISEFLTAHHQAAMDGRLNDLVRDYADMVDYLKGKPVTRESILNEETDYRRNYRIITEAYKGKLDINASSSSSVRVGYELFTEWQRVSDNKTGNTTLRVDMKLEKQSGGWRIVRQRTEKLK